MFNLKTFIGMYDVANENCAASIVSIEENTYGEALAARASLVDDFKRKSPSSVAEAKEIEDFDCKLYYETLGANPELLVPSKFNAFMEDIKRSDDEAFYVPLWKSEDE